MRISIHGSCVARDTFEYLPSTISLTRYIARQSLISAGTTCPEVFAPREELDSAFQVRMLSGDLAGDFYRHLEQIASETDLLLVDLTDERLGVFALPDGSYLTRTVEGLAHELYPEDLPLLELGDQAHFDLFCSAVETWADAVDAAGLTDRVAVLHVPWASHTVDGDPTPPSFKLSADLANVVYSRYHHVFFDHVNPWVIRPRCAVTAQEDHQWGAAPFHYVPEVHQDLAEQIEDLATRLGPRD